MKLIVKNGTVIAIHSNDQDVVDLYPGCTEIMAPAGTMVADAEGRFSPLADIDLGDPWPPIRAHRDELLAATDWTQLSDAPLDDTAKAAWATYRQSLRDIPQSQSGAAGYLDIVWPDSPGAA